jgi:hypothetical protein
MILRNLRGRLVDVQPEWVDYRLKEGFTVPRKHELQQERVIQQVQEEIPQMDGKYLRGLPYI